MRFPGDFMFQLTEEEFENLKPQIATSSWGGRRIAPYAFTEHGVLMLSSVLSSEIAINVNIQIMRIYTKMREMDRVQKARRGRIARGRKRLIYRNEHALY